MAVAWGRWTSPGGLQRQRRFEAVRTGAFDLTLPTIAGQLQGVASAAPPPFVTLAQRQLQAFQTPVPQAFGPQPIPAPAPAPRPTPEPSLVEQLENIVNSPIFGPQQPEPGSEPPPGLRGTALAFAPETVPVAGVQEAAFAGAPQPFQEARIQAGIPRLREFGEAIQGAPPEQLDFLQQLNQQLQRRNISVEDFTRVANEIMGGTTQPSPDAEEGRFFTAAEA